MADPRKFIGKDADWLSELLSLAFDNLHHLNDDSQRFLIGTRERFNLYGSHTMLSEKQRAWLRDIEQRLVEAGAVREEDRPEDEYEGLVPVDEFMRGRR